MIVAPLTNKDAFDETGYPRKVTLTACVECGALTRKTTGTIKRCKPCAGARRGES